MAKRDRTRLAAGLLALAAVAAAAGAALAEAPLPPRWQADQPGGATDAVAADGRLFVAGPGGLRAYARATGRLLWEAPAPAAPSLCADGQSVWMAGAGALQRLAADSGRLQVQVAIDSAALVLAPEPVKNRLLVEADDGGALLDARTLSTLARLPVPLFHWRAPFVRQSGQWRARLDERGGRLFFIARGRLNAMSLADGQVRWQNGEQLARDWPTFHRGRIYFFSDNLLHCRDGKRGKAIWDHAVFSSKRADPTMVISGMTPPGRRHLSWPRAWWRKLKALPSMFHQNRLTAIDNFGLIYQFTNHDDRAPLAQPLPGEVTPLADVGMSIYYLCVYHDERTDQTKSLVERWHKRSAQLYGRSPIVGRASGFFAVGGRRCYAELAPGRLIELDLDELAPRRSWQSPDEELAALPDDGGVLFAVTRGGRVAAIAME